MRVTRLARCAETGGVVWPCGAWLRAPGALLRAALRWDATTLATLDVEGVAGRWTVMSLAPHVRHVRPERVSAPTRDSLAVAAALRDLE